MPYFTELPKTLYPNLDAEDGTYVQLTNILTRSNFLREVNENVSLFYDYEVKDGETPEVIAEKLYGDVGRFWIVLMFNNLSNPYYDFPLVQEQVHDLITQKYTQSIEDSQTTIHHWEERITRTVFYNQMPQSSNVTTFVVSELQQNSNTGIAEARPYLPMVADTVQDGGSYTEVFPDGVTIGVSYQYAAISNYAHEQSVNEKKRRIRLLDAGYVGTVEAELRRLMTA
jgi:hypothetical protein